MPTKYRTQSANVLNEADSFERKLDWMLFKSEQEKILYGGGENEWKPGDSLVEAMWETNKAAWPDDYMFWEGSPGVYDRPMIQEYEDGEHYRYMRCTDCLVDFPSTVANCWFCGQEYEVHAPSEIERFFSDATMLRGLMPDVRARRGGLRYGVDRAVIGQINSSEITDEGLVVHGTFEGTTFLSVDPARPSSFSIDDLVAVDLQFSLTENMHAYWMEIFAPHIPPHVQVAEQADETPVCDEFDATFASDNLFMAEADPDVPFVLPREVDLTPRRREVPVPIIDVSGGSLQRRIQDNRYYDSTPITEQRRTR